MSALTTGAGNDSDGPETVKGADATAALAWPATAGCAAPDVAKIVNGITFDVPPPGVGVDTVTGTLPAVAISAAEMDALIPVVPTYCVVRLLPFHCTTEQGNKLPPFTVSRNAFPPAVALGGASDVIAGAGKPVVGAVMVKVRELELIAELVTVMFAVP